jgi:8-oxo-dGTP pyrophosphatase MutT (NUDIX family)
MAEALARELVEEGNIEILEPPVLHGLFFNSLVSQRDHVALFIVRSFRQQRELAPNGEIAAHGFFPLDALPENTTPATPRSCWAHLFQNGGDEMGARWGMTEQG